MALISCSKNIDKYSISPFSLEKGKSMLLLMPVGEDIKVCERHRESIFHVKYQPYWVRFTLEKINKETVKLINENIDYLHSFFSVKFGSYHTFDKDNILKLSGWDVRLINLFLMRKKVGMDFFEINTAGLSISSIKLMFQFILRELNESNYKSTYLVVQPVDKISENNPLIIDEGNLDIIYKKVYKE